MMYDTPRPKTFANIREPIYDMSSIRTTRPTMATIPTTSAHPLIINSRLFPFWDLLTTPYDKTTRKTTTTESARTTTSVWVRTPTTTTSPPTTYFNTPPTTLPSRTTLSTTTVMNTSSESPQDHSSNITSMDHFPEIRISNMSTRLMTNDTGSLSEKAEGQDIENLLSLR
ncbi:hypothetical protein TELCIR_09356 [Teladorsagia circumcincta]|uniref:Uncharacterized protein n=1 Tax=Teladorsagia circumcincta TaxID=45464 RepID=A0A2G9UFA1_TELCI|nr:hypothetical protein TELCIR_09356 [Teladorsagia circumcincta]